MNPFSIQGPAVISFSGGRTSGYMLARILEVGLAPDVYVLFADTGHEMPATYQFVQECADRFRVPIHWVRYGEGEVEPRPIPSGAETPFDRLLKVRGFLPGPGLPYCSTELKIRPMKEWMLSRGYEHWTMVVGIRADESRRLAKAAGTAGRERWDVEHPLARAGIMKRDVILWWKKQRFDLQLAGEWEGNCDLCHQKSAPKRIRMARQFPERAEWWMRHEERTGQRFRLDEPPLRELVRLNVSQGDLFAEDLPHCVCGGSE